MMNEFLHIDTTETMFPSPSRGSYFSIDLREVLEQTILEFPSPSRGSYFSIMDEKAIMEALKERFRPLHGDLISQ